MVLRLLVMGVRAFLPINTFTIWPLLVAAAPALLSAQQTTQGRLMFKGHAVEVIAADATPDGIEPSGPAKLCVVGTSRCFTAPKHDPQFGFSPKAEVVQINDTQQAVLFTAVASASGSGTLTLLVLLDLRNGNWVNLLPDEAITNQGEYKMWRESRVSTAALFVVADFVWGEGETHFAEHRFKVTTYTFGANTRSYYLRDRYVTSGKYSSLDDVDEVDVLSHEKSEIVRRLLRQK
jgi:hypothetical protein